jgi:transcriptional regulator with XRE-family HTH domain
MENIKEEIAKNLKRLREARQVTQKQLADYLGVKYNTVSSWEIGKNSIDIVVLIKICDFLKVSLNDIYGKTYKEEPVITTDEQELLYIYRKLPAIFKPKLMGFVETLEGLLSGPEETLAAREA